MVAVGFLVAPSVLLAHRVNSLNADDDRSRWSLGGDRSRGSHGHIRYESDPLPSKKSTVSLLFPYGLRSPVSSLLPPSLLFSQVARLPSWDDFFIRLRKIVLFPLPLRFFLFGG